MTTYYIERTNVAENYDVERKKKSKRSDTKNEKQKIGRATLLKKTERGELKSQSTKKRGRYDSESKTRKKGMSMQFCLDRGCEKQFHTIDKPSSWENWFLDEFVKKLYFCPFFSVFGHFFGNSWIRSGNPVNWTFLKFGSKSFKIPFINIWN